MTHRKHEVEGIELVRVDAGLGRGLERALGRVLVGWAARDHGEGEEEDQGPEGDPHGWTVMRFGRKTHRARRK